MKLVALMLLFTASLLLTIAHAYADSCKVAVTYQRSDGSPFVNTKCVPNGGTRCNSGAGGYCAPGFGPSNPGIAGKNCFTVGRC